MNCINCQRPMSPKEPDEPEDGNGDGNGGQQFSFSIKDPNQYSCPFCGVQMFHNPNELSTVSVAWLDQAPCFKPIGPIGANVPFAAPIPVMKFLTTDCDFRLQL